MDIRSLVAATTILAFPVLTSCGRDSSLQGSESNDFAGGDSTARAEFDDALATRKYFAFTSRGATVEVSIGVVRLPGAIRRWEWSPLPTTPILPSHGAFLDTIAAAEGTSYRSRCNDQGGYNVSFGGGCFDDFSRHPDHVVRTSRYASAAAGRYQFMPYTWRDDILGFVRDWFSERVQNVAAFGPRAQDLGAARLIKHKRGNTGAWELISRIAPDADGKWNLEDFNAFRGALNALAKEWASLPTWSGQSFYGQPVHLAGHLWEVFKAAYPLYTEGADGETGRGPTISQQAPESEATEPTIALDPVQRATIDEQTRAPLYL